MIEIDSCSGVVRFGIASQARNSPTVAGIRRTIAPRLALAGMLLISPSALRAQNGDPLIYSNQKSVADALYLDVAKADTGDTDICARIQTAWKALTVDSGVLDARSITGVQKCESDPFLDPSTGRTTAHHGVLLLGNALIQTTVPWIVPGFIRVEGVGEALSAGSPHNTILQAVSGFSNSGNGTLCAANAVVCLGRNAQSFRVQVRHLTVDCNLLSGCIGIYNGAAEEGSYLQDVTITNAAGAGLEVNLAQFTINGANYNGAVNSGPYRNVTISFTGPCPGNICSPSTVGILVQNYGNKPNYGGVVREFDGVTVSGALTGATLGQGILIAGASTNVTNSHVEYFPTAIQIGDGNSPTNGVELTNLFVSNTNSGTGVYIAQDPNSGSGDVFISGLNFQGSSNSLAIDDRVSNHTLTDAFVALYAVGHGATPKVVSTSSSVTSGGKQSQAGRSEDKTTIEHQE